MSSSVVNQSSGQFPIPKLLGAYPVAGGHLVVYRTRSAPNFELRGDVEQPLDAEIDLRLKAFGVLVNDAYSNNDKSAREVVDWIPQQPYLNRVRDDTWWKSYTARLEPDNSTFSIILYKGFSGRISLQQSCFFLEKKNPSIGIQYVPRSSWGSASVFSPPSIRKRLSEKTGSLILEVSYNREVGPSLCKICVLVADPSEDTERMLVSFLSQKSGLDALLSFRESGAKADLQNCSLWSSAKERCHHVQRGSDSIVFYKPEAVLCVLGDGSLVLQSGIEFCRWSANYLGRISFQDEPTPDSKEDSKGCGGRESKSQ